MSEDYVTIKQLSHLNYQYKERHCWFVIGDLSSSQDWFIKDNTMLDDHRLLLLNSQLLEYHGRKCNYHLPISYRDITVGKIVKQQAAHGLNALLFVCSLIPTHPRHHSNTMLCPARLTNPASTTLFFTINLPLCIQSRP